LAVLFASLIIVFYIGYSFRKVPKPANSWEFGIAAIIALAHDTLIVIGVFSFLGKFANVEVDPLFITGLLTVIGFSVHDTIVIFDRIRENLIKKGASEFEETINLSLFEMLPRTINTSFLVWSILLILFLFGGLTIRYFVLTLVIGILAGSYSSLLVASPLLVTWQELKHKKAKSK
jgi:preprotein translocase subunit SecF